MEIEPADSELESFKLVTAGRAGARHWQAPAPGGPGTHGLSLVAAGWHGGWASHARVSQTRSPVEGRVTVLRQDSESEEILPFRGDMICLLSGQIRGDMICPHDECRDKRPSGHRWIKRIRTYVFWGKEGPIIKTRVYKANHLASTIYKIDAYESVRETSSA